MARNAIHPSEHLAEQIQAFEISAAEPAPRLGVPMNRMTVILNGQRAVTGHTALRLGHSFGNSPQFWMALQSLYDLRKTAERAGDAIRALPSLAC